MRLSSAFFVALIGIILSSHGIEADSKGRVGRDKKKGLKSKMNNEKKEKKGKARQQGTANVVIGGERLLIFRPRTRNRCL